MPEVDYKALWVDEKKRVRDLRARLTQAEAERDALREEVAAWKGEVERLRGERGISVVTTLSASTDAFDGEEDHDA